ncbi:MAG: hypothetical protein ACXWVD_00565 [Telluria sp.]
MNHLTTRSASSTSTDWPEPALPRAWIERLFEKMLLEYGAKFTNQWGGTDPQLLKRHWAQRLYGLTGEQLATGMEALATRDWPPTLPEFVKLCCPPIDPLRAYHEALAGLAAREHGQLGHWSHPAIFHAAVRIGKSTLQNSEWRHIRERWEQVLADVLAEGSWLEVKKPDLQIGLAAATEKVADALAQLRNLGATLTPKGGVAWAHKVVERHAAGDTTVTPAMIESAHTALDRLATVTPETPETCAEGGTDAPAQV